MTRSRLCAVAAVAALLAGCSSPQLDPSNPDSSTQRLVSRASQAVVDATAAQAASYASRQIAAGATGVQIVVVTAPLCGPADEHLGEQVHLVRITGTLDGQPFTEELAVPEGVAPPLDLPPGAWQVSTVPSPVAFCG